MTPSPLHTIAPRKTKNGSKVSATVSVVFCQSSGAASLVASWASPFKALWSALRHPFTITPSAGIRSPACRSTQSSFTRSFIDTSVIVPLRQTLQVMREASSCSCLKAFSLRNSELVETNTARKIATAIPTVSYHSAWPRQTKMVFKIKAAKRILIIGSVMLLRSFCQNVSCFFSVRALVPYLARDSSTSRSVNPVNFIKPKLPYLDI